MNFTPIQKLIERSANKANIKRQLDTALICSIARDIIESDYPKLHRETEVRSFKNNMLYIDTRTSIVSQELYYDKTKILEKLNEKIKGNKIKDIKISIKKNA